ncbi:sugar ABC transporter permease [Paenibacillus aurantius]|uniref:Sugar ABC transporter permease n=1 Tax=Paenibacillus aurantius TaxID=2918900 RepID=A0AA96LC11_9BACL|nr:sugar ABC transporter permease [Paenibacillus aurantius]WNQ11184.1 sugar ABC transporter permease [Paenibacillus aurantius]
MKAMGRSVELSGVRTALKPRIRRWSKEKAGENAIGYLFLAPSLLLFGVFLFYPFVRSLYLSLQVTNPRGKVVDFAGWDNFRELFASEGFYRSLLVTAKFTLLTVPPGIVIALVLAGLTHQALRGMKVFNWVFSMPVAISVGTGAVIWMQLYHQTTGMFNRFLQLAGLPAVSWLSDPNYALYSVSAVTIWMGLGFHYILLLGGIRSIPSEIYESARIDGAGAFVAFRRITLPLLSPTLFFVGIVSVIGSFQAFGEVRILTGGGPIHTTEVLVYSIYREAFVNYRFGPGSAQALVLFAIILVLTLIQYKALEKKVHYQ